MQLKPELLERLEQAIEIEIKTLELLAQARHRAAEIINATLSKPEPPSREQSATVRLLLQFVSRPFRPLDILLRTGRRATPQHQGQHHDAALAALLQHAL